jgi:hypothetical protein
MDFVCEELYAFKEKVVAIRQVAFIDGKLFDVV